MNTHKRETAGGLFDCEFRSVERSRDVSGNFGGEGRLVALQAELKSFCGTVICGTVNWKEHYAASRRAGSEDRAYHGRQ